MRNNGSRDFPGFATLTYQGVVVMADLGLWVGARVDDTVHVSATSYFGSEFLPLQMGVTDSLALVYILHPGSGPGEDDYDAWPVRAGAPVDATGRPRLIGDGTAWTAYDDRDPSTHTIFHTAPLGVAVRATVWGYAEPDSVLFVHFRIENTSGRAWQDVFVGVWADPDIGNAENDLAGCDVSRSLGFVYTAPNVPETLFGSYQPAVGILLLKTPGDAGFYAFPRIWKADTEPRTADEAYRLLQGLNVDGSAFHDSTTGEPTRFTASGDPVTATGSIEHVPADRRILSVIGPFAASPGDKLDLTYAIVFARDTRALRAITRLRVTSDAVASNRALWDLF